MSFAENFMAVPFKRSRLIIVSGGGKSIAEGEVPENKGAEAQRTGVVEGGFWNGGEKDFDAAPLGATRGKLRCRRRGPGVIYPNQSCYR
jgi:hypothetical protein